MLFLWLPRNATRVDVREMDLYVYYQTAVRLAHGQPIYTGPFVYPQMFAALTPGTNSIMGLGNIDLIIWALVAWSLPAGAGLALAACLKVYPAVVAVAAVVRRPSTAWRQLGAATALVSFSLLLLGPGPFAEWLRSGATPLPDCTL